MSGYNAVFESGSAALSFDALNPEYPALSPRSGQPEAAMAPFQHSVEVEFMEGDTAAQLGLEVDPAPAEGSGSLGSNIARWHSRTSKCVCAVCHEPYPTDSALHQHAIETQHQAYRCKCGTGFNKASALKRHIETKDAPKTFACILCYDKFNRKDKLKDHCRHYHKVTDQGLQFLFTSQEVRPRTGAASRRRRAPVPRAAASSGTPASPAHAPATVGPSGPSFPASTGQQYGAILASPSAPTCSPATTSAFQVPDSFPVPNGQFSSGSDAFAVDPALGQDFSDLFDSFIGNGNWATGSNGFNF